MKKQFSPFRKMSSITFIEQPVHLQENKHKNHHNNHQIQTLINRFNELNDQFQIQSDLTSFNLIHFKPENDKIKFDPQVMAAQLKKVQNRVEINRAQREIENRERKRMKKHYTYQHKHHREHEEDYQTIYKQYVENRKVISDFEALSDDQEPENKSNRKVAYANQLKRHPILLEYTINKISNKEKMDQEKADKKKIMIEDYKKQNHQISKQYSDILDQLAKKLSLKNDHNPEEVMTSRLNKFFSKKSPNKISNEVKSIPRFSRMLEKQNSIVSEMNERSISKQNRNKLQNRLNEIILTISKSQKLSNNLALPKISNSFREEKIKEDFN